MHIRTSSYFQAWPGQQMYYWDAAKCQFSEWQLSEWQHAPGQCMFLFTSSLGSIFHMSHVHFYANFSLITHDALREFSTTLKVYNFQTIINTVSIISQLFFVNCPAPSDKFRIVTMTVKIKLKSRYIKREIVHLCNHLCWYSFIKVSISIDWNSMWMSHYKAHPTPVPPLVV